MKKIIQRFSAGFFLSLSFVLLSSPLWASVETYVKTVSDVQKGMTLWRLLQAGGFVMVFIGLLSILELALIIYFFMYLKTEKLLPLQFAREVISKISAKKISAAKDLLSGNDNLFSRIVLQGLDRMDQGDDAVKEALEIAAKNEATQLWGGLSYFADMAQVGPLVGLLGTVLGLIQAFNSIALEYSVVKPVLLAAGVAKAMITTAGGLTVAIPAVIAYAFFRSKILRITSTIEVLVSEILGVISRSGLR